MTTTITCPNCAIQFEPNDSIRDEIRKEFNQKWVAEQRKKDEEFKLKETQLIQQQQLLDRQRQQQEEEFAKRVEAERKVMTDRLSAQLKKSLTDEYDARLKHFEQLVTDKDEKIKLAQQKELENLQLKDELVTLKQDIDLTLQKKILEERERIYDAFRKDEEEKGKLKDHDHQMKIKELEQKLEAQMKLAEEMRRKAEQGSMQLQGEVQELALEALLRYSFPFDLVEEVGKGVKGADCILTIRNNYGQECGKIIFESKRTKDFSNEWIEKLKKDKRTLGINVAVLVTQAMPKELDGFGEKDGIWICSFNDVKALVHVLRELVIQVFNASKNNENKGDKMALLYNYLISHEFAEQWRAIREGFMSMKMSIQRERDQMEKLWKAREKQLEKVLLNAAHIKGSIEGISGTDVDLTLIDEDNNYLIE